MEKEIKKYEYKIKDWKFNKDPTFLANFTEGELNIGSIG
jgi:hypothetical protein